MVILNAYFRCLAVTPLRSAALVFHGFHKLPDLGFHHLLDLVVSSFLDSY